jgi:hypothetical protein
LEGPLIALVPSDSDVLASVPPADVVSGQVARQ